MMLQNVGPTQSRGPAGLLVQIARRRSQWPLTDTHTQPVAPNCGAVLIWKDDEGMASSFPTCRAWGQGQGRVPAPRGGGDASSCALSLHAERDASPSLLSPHLLISVS